MIVNWRCLILNMRRGYQGVIEISYDQSLEYNLGIALPMIDWYNHHIIGSVPYWISNPSCSLTLCFNSKFDSDRFITRWLI